ncbi:MAG: acyl-CoA synthetase, partial [candidate division GAL15 bacterium]
MVQRTSPGVWSHETWTAWPPHRFPLTPLSFLYRSLHAFPQELALVDGSRRTSYGEFSARVFRLASALRRWGLQPGDRVAILCRNAQEVLEAHFGVPQAGGVLVPINVRLSPHEVSCIVDHSGVKFLLAERALGELAAAPCRTLDSAPLVLWVDLGPRHGTVSPQVPGGLAAVAYEALLSEGSPDPFPAPLAEEEEILRINDTSGTTGGPKGVMVTHRGCTLHPLGEVIEAGLGPGSRYLWTLPMFHCNGWNFPYAVTAVGATHLPRPLTILTAASPPAP